MGRSLQDAVVRRQRTIQATLFFIILLTLPCYCIGFVLLGLAPRQTLNAPTAQFTGTGPVTATPITLTSRPSITPLGAGTLISTIGPTPGQIFTPTRFRLPPTATWTFLPPTLTPIIFPTETPIIIVPPTSTPITPTTTPLPPTETPIETPIILPTETPTETPLLLPTDTPTDIPTETPTETQAVAYTLTETPTIPPTETPSPTATELVLPTATETASATPTETETPMP